MLGTDIVDVRSSALLLVLLIARKNWRTTGSGPLFRAMWLRAESSLVIFFKTIILTLAVTMKQTIRQHRLDFGGIPHLSRRLVNDSQ